MYPCRLAPLRDLGHPRCAIANLHGDTQPGQTAPPPPAAARKLPALPAALPHTPPGPLVPGYLGCSWVALHPGAQSASRIQMPSAPPNRLKSSARAPASASKMAAAKIAKAKPAKTPSKSSNGASKAKSQMHRRSRSGMLARSLTRAAGPARPLLSEAAFSALRTRGSWSIMK